MIKVICDYCGKEFETYPSLYSPYKNHFCSKDCANEYQRRNKFEAYCEVCGKYLGLKSQSKRNKNDKYLCSKKCEGIYFSDTRFTPNNYKHIDNYLEIEINTKEYGKVYCLLDDEFEYLLETNKFFAKYSKDSKTFVSYFEPKMARTKTLIHRFITSCPKGLQVDHINHNGLDNRKQNLRVCTQFENQQNRRLNSKSKSKYKNVIWDKRYNKWLVKFQINYKQKYYGRYTNLEDAIEVAKSVRKEIHPFSTDTYVY